MLLLNRFGVVLLMVCIIIDIFSWLKDWEGWIVVDCWNCILLVEMGLYLGELLKIGLEFVVDGV